nr:hypothetical protein CFP56_41975 [Quercus suber]
MSAMLWKIPDSTTKKHVKPAMEIELDAKLVVNLLKKEVQNPNSNDAFVADCREGLKEIPLICVQHCYRGSQQVC